MLAGMSYFEEFDQAAFDAFRADPKRQALVKRILSDEDEVVLGTGHVVGAVYRSRYWGGTYRVIGLAAGLYGPGVEVECVTPGGGAHQVPGERWTHSTDLDPREERLS